MDKFVHFRANAGNGCAHIVKLNVGFIESLSKLPTGRAEIVMVSGKRWESFDDYEDVIRWLVDEVGISIEE